MYLTAVLLFLQSIFNNTERDRENIDEYRI